ncbi:hypothetical protein QWY86_07735 [Pedobacter aquatilis]|nr:hypothetical protein [Pedobacter aquatilis]MDN3586549.1 hypothetical protein [Pedobacter aquatilis]
MERPQARHECGLVMLAGLQAANSFDNSIFKKNKESQTTKIAV